MQINYPFGNDRTGYAPMWYPPNPDADLRDMDVPPIYAPYAVKPYWPPSIQNAAALSGFGDAPPSDLSPISLVSPMPSIVTGGNSVSSASVPTAPLPSFQCTVANWVNNNPALAALVGVGVFFAFAGGKRR